MAGIHIINIGKTWEKLVFAARIIAAIENHNDVCVISARPYGHRAVLKFAANTGAQAIAGRFTPGSFTNYITRSFKEPRLIIVTDPRVDHQAIREASYVNIPVIALCDTDAPLKFVDVAIPTNNKTKHSIGLIWWLLAREVLRLRGTIPRSPDGWNVMVDMFFYRDPEEVEKQQQEEAAAKVTGTVGEEVAAPTEWDVSGGHQPGGINPTLVESCKYSFPRRSQRTDPNFQLLSGPSKAEQQTLTGQPNQAVVTGQQMRQPQREVVGIRRHHLRLFIWICGSLQQPQYILCCLMSKIWSMSFLVICITAFISLHNMKYYGQRFKFLVDFVGISLYCYRSFFGPLSEFMLGIRSLTPRRQ